MPSCSVFLARPPRFCYLARAQSGRQLDLPTYPPVPAGDRVEEPQAADICDGCDHVAAYRPSSSALAGSASLICRDVSEPLHAVGYRAAPVEGGQGLAANAP